MKKEYIALFVALILLSCSQRENDVSRRIAKQIESRNQSLDFSTIAPFEWDRVFFFEPYTPESTIEQAIGCPWAEYKKCGIEYNDSCTLILFLSKGRVAAWCMNPRNKGEFATLYNSNGYAKSEAHFMIDFSGSAGWPNIRKK